MQPYCSSRETATARSACDRSGCPHTSLEPTRLLERLVRRSGGGGRGLGRRSGGARGVPRRTRATTSQTTWRRRRARWTQPSRRRRRRRRRRPTSHPLRRSILRLVYEGLGRTNFIYRHMFVRFACCAGVALLHVQPELCSTEATGVAEAQFPPCPYPALTGWSICPVAGASNAGSSVGR